MIDQRIEQIHAYGIDYRTRALYLFGRDEYVIGAATSEGDAGEPGIEYTIANQFIKNLRILESLGDGPITIHMKTCGGIWEEGMAIYDAIINSPCYIRIISYTHARSMSSLIFQAADERVMMPNSVFMIHLGTVTLHGTGTQFHTEYSQQVKTEQTMLDIYVEAMKTHGVYSDQSREWIESWLRQQMKSKEDFYMSPDEAIELGFADSIYERPSK